MSKNGARTLLIECGSCEIENSVTEYTARNLPVCNQCREPLIEPNLNETHNELVCEICGTHILLLKTTEVTIGDSQCICGSKQLNQQSSSSILKQAEKAGAFNMELSETGLDDADMFRSEPDAIMDDDYNDLFNQDPGMN